MQNLYILGLCFAFGYILRVTKRIPENAHKTINAFILYISLPAQILLFVRKISFSTELLFPAGMAWIVFFITFSILLICKRIFSIESKVMGCLVLTAGLGNTSFLGLPMIEAFFGKEYNHIGILCDQPGTFLLLSLVAIPIALHQSTISVDLLSLFKRVVTFPPFLSFMLAICLSFVTFNSDAINVLNRLGDTLAPLALFSVGFQLNFTGIKKLKKELYLGLMLKMMLAPLFIFLLYLIILKNTSMVAKISVFESAMPPMITGGIIAIENDLAPDLASTMIAMGVLLSAVTLPVWRILLA